MNLKNVILVTLLKRSLLRPACAIEISLQESSMNRFKLLLISYSCQDNFHVCDNHMHVVWSHLLAT